MPMKSKRPTSLSREARWRNKVKSWPNMALRMADSSSESNSNSSNSSEEESEGPSRETTEAPDVHPKMWQEEDVKPNQDVEVSQAWNEGIKVPPGGSGTVVSNSKIRKAVTCLSSDGAGKAGYYSMQGGLHGVTATTSPGDMNHTGSEGEPPQRRSFDCTVCGKKLFSVRKVQEHPDLGVGICRACYSFLFSSPYTKDTTDCSEEQCRWCGQGGRIVMCDDCDKSFCESCIVRNYGPKTLALIVSSDNWSCFCCNPELLRTPIDELKEFEASARQPSETNNNAPFKRKSWTEQLIVIREDSVLGIDVGGATIAELLTQEEERRKQHNGRWTNSRGRAKSTAPPIARSRKRPKTISTYNPTWLHTEVLHALPANNEVKQEPWVAVDPQAPASATATEVRSVNRLMATDNNKRAPASAATEVKQKHEVVIEKQAPASATPATRTWIRPHQWEQKRKEAAERRKRGAEAELRKNVSDDDLKHTKSNMSENLQQNAMVAAKKKKMMLDCQDVPSGIARDLSDAICRPVTQAKVKEIVS